MSEMPDVVTLTTISSTWGNQIRDRTVQRYSSVANRTTEHPSPAEGDLSYLEDSNSVWVYTGAAWVNIAQNVDTVDIADSAVTTAKIADGTILAGDLADTAISGGWVDFAQNVDNNALALTTSFQNCASVSIDFTALGWGSGRLLGWGSVGADGASSPIGLNVRVVLANDFGTATALTAESGVGTLPGLSSSASHWVTTLSSGTKTATIQASKIGTVTTTKRYAWVCVWAVRTS